MKTMLFSIVSLAVTMAFSAQKHAISGSDTLGGVMTDAIIAAGMDQEVVYTGGGSGVGEKAIQNGEIGITAMSREMKPEVVDLLKAKGVEVVSHVIALDGLALFVNKGNALPGMDLGTIKRIYTCEIKSWSQIPGAGRVGAIKAYRRNDSSGTTDTFKTLLGVKTFGDCVTVLNETADIAEKTSKEADAIGYAGLSGTAPGNRALSISQTGAQFIQANTAMIRNGSYPLTRKLYIYEVRGNQRANGVESKLLGYLLDRSFLDPIVQDHDFVTLN